MLEIEPGAALEATGRRGAVVSIAATVRIVKVSLNLASKGDQYRDIVMNPPFKDADRHVRHGLDLLPEDGRLAVLLRMTWIAAKRRADLLTYLETLLICGRLRMPPADVIDKGLRGTPDFAWAVFRPSPSQVMRIVRG